MKMRVHMGSIAAMGAACLMAVSFGDIAYSEEVHLNCQGVDQECLVSDVPVPGVRIVQQKDYHKRPAYYLSSNLYTTLASGRETGNTFVSFDFQVPNGGGPLPHTHRNEWETFYVEEGTVTFITGVTPDNLQFTTQEVGAGTVVYGPQGPIHGFINQSGKFARIFSFAMPAGLENFFHNSGTSVKDYNAPIPKLDAAEIIRTAFWAGQRGDALWVLCGPCQPIPPDPPGIEMVVASYKTAPAAASQFGNEKRVELLTPGQVGNITGAEAFCGPPPLPFRPGGTVRYEHLTFPARKDIPPTISPKFDAGSSFQIRSTTFYTQTGRLTFLFTDPKDFRQRRVDVEPLSFIQIDPGVEYSIANLDDGPGPKKSSDPATSLEVTVLDPPGYPASCGFTLFPPL